MGILLLSFVIFVCNIPNIRTDEEDASTTAFPLSTRFQRIRSQRLSILRQYVLSSLGFDTPPVLNRDRNNLVRTSYLNVINEYQRRKIQENRCYLPYCDIPDRIDSDLWRVYTNKTMNLYFSPLSFNDEHVEVINATLKLYVNPQPLPLRDRRFIVYVLQFMKPLKRRKRKRLKLLNANMVRLARYGEWSTFNVTEAAIDWLSDRRKNNGLLVRISSGPFSSDVPITNVFGEPECESIPDIECDSAGVPFVFQLSSRAVLEVYTEKNAFSKKRK